MRTDRVNRLLGTDLARRGRAVAARAHRLRRGPGRRAGHVLGHHPDLPARHLHRDRRDRGGRPPPRLQPHPQARCPRPCRSGRSPPLQRDRRTIRQVLVGLGRARGHAAAVPRAGRPRPRRPAGRRPSPSPTRWLPRSRCCARRCARVCCGRWPTTSRTAPGRGPVRDRQGLRRPAGRHHPARRARAPRPWCWPAPRPPLRSRSGRSCTDTLGLAGRGHRPEPGRGRPAPRPLGRARPSTAPSSARSARSTPACSTPSASASGSPGSRSTSAPLLGAAPRRAPLPTRSAGTPRATSTWPSRSTRPSRPAMSPRPSGARPASCSST